MAKSEVIQATCMVLTSSSGCVEPLLSFFWCFFRLEGVIQPSPSEPSDSDSCTSSTEGSVGGTVTVARSVVARSVVARSIAGSAGS